jgi:hypothetical protein
MSSVATVGFSITLVALSALGVGSHSKIIGLHVPFIRESETTWIRSHRAALYLIAPACLLSFTCAIVGMKADYPTLARLGWLIWISGPAAGALLASATAKSLSIPKG